MNNEIEAQYVIIGDALVGVIGREFDAAWIYAEVKEDVAGVSIFYRGSDDLVHHRPPDLRLADAIYGLWEMFTTAGLASWSCATFSLDGHGAFRLELGYDDFDHDGSTIMSRREEWIRRHLGDAVIESQASRSG